MNYILSYFNRLQRLKISIIPWIIYTFSIYKILTHSAILTHYAIHIFYVAFDRNLDIRQKALCPKYHFSFQ